MARVYGTAKICPFEKQDCDLATEGLNLDPGSFLKQSFKL
jgi:hypothetical protein